MNYHHRALYCSIVAALALACKAPQTPSPTSPTHDHRPPATDPGDGEVIGADRVPAEEKLETGPRLDTGEGVKPADQPPGD
jgi:hypothetical protein